MYPRGQKDKDLRSVRLQVRRSTDPIELHTFAKEQDTYIRVYVAENTYTSNETLEELSRDLNPTVRLHVVFNPTTSSDIILRLTKDLDQTIALKANERVTNTLTLIIGD